MAGEKGTTRQMECLGEGAGEEEEKDEDDEDDVGQQRRQRFGGESEEAMPRRRRLLVHSSARKKQMELKVQRLAVNEQLKLRGLEPQRASEPMGQ